MKKLLLVATIVIIAAILLSGCGITRDLCPAYTDLEPKLEQIENQSQPNTETIVCFAQCHKHSHIDIY